VAEVLLEARSPLAALLQSGRAGRADGPAGVRLRERRPIGSAALLLRSGGRERLAAALRADFGLELPVTPRRSTCASLSLVWSGPRQWLAFEDRSEACPGRSFVAGLARAVGDAATVIELSGARALFDIEGPETETVLSRIVPVDLDSSVFGNDAVALTLAGHVGVALWRRGSAAAFTLACSRSFAASLAEALIEAALCVGCEVLDPV